VQDPLTSQYFPYTYALPATYFTSLRAGITLGDWLITPFVDNLFDSHTVTNYALGQLDAYIPVIPPGAPNQVPPAHRRTITPSVRGPSASPSLGTRGGSLRATRQECAAMQAV
jgi:hypothetical protein